MWAKGVFETIGRSKVYKPEKVLEILESRDQKNKNKIKGKNERFVLAIHPWGPSIEGTLRNILELFLHCSHLEPLEPKGKHPYCEEESKNGEHQY